MLQIDERIASMGYEYIACIDEVGRGCLAGDVVACAIILPKNLFIDGVKDSKKLSEKKREELYEKIISNCIAWGIGRVSSTVIDEINIKESTKLAMKLAVQNLEDSKGNRIVPDFLLIDAEKIDLDIQQESIFKGDEILATGTYKDICSKLGITYQTFRFYSTPTYKKRTKPENARRLVCLSDNKDDGELLSIIEHKLEFLNKNPKIHKDKINVLKEIILEYQEAINTIEDF